MVKRILTSVVGLIVFFAVVFAHQYVIYAAIALVTAGMLHEMYDMLDVKRSLRAVGFLALLMMLAAFLAGKTTFAFYAAVTVFMLSMVALHKKADCREVLAAAAVTVFIAASMLTLILTRKEFGRPAVILPFVIAWLTDTGAYFAGSLFGRHKLVPNISPKKTIEGAVGGTVLAMLGGITYAWIVNGYSTDITAALSFAVIGIAGSVISQIGDLIASAIKRDCKKKDYGTILPGHGGILDRFDSVLFAAPFIYFALTYTAL